MNKKKKIGWFLLALGTGILGFGILMSITMGTIIVPICFSLSILVNSTGVLLVHSRDDKQ